MLRSTGNYAKNPEYLGKSNGTHLTRKTMLSICSSGPVAELMKEGTSVPSRAEVIAEIQVEAAFLDGTNWVTVPNPAI